MGSAEVASVLLLFGIKAFLSGGLMKGSRFKLEKDSVALGHFSDSRTLMHTVMPMESKF